MLAERFDRFRTLRNNSQQHATTCNRVCKRTQRVTSNNVGNCWPKMLCSFARGSRQTAQILWIGGDFWKRQLIVYAKRDERWTNTVRIRQNLCSHTNILRTDLERKWRPWPPDSNLTSAEVTEFVSRPCYFTIIAITQLKPLWRRERHSCTEFIFSEKHYFT